MFTAGVPEKIIKSVTGHKSSKALELYERPTVDQMKAVSKVMTNPKSSFLCEVEQLQSSKDEGNSIMTEIQQDVRQSYKRKQVSNEKTNYGLVRSMFSGLSDCPITFSPQTMVINIQPPSSTTD